MDENPYSPPASSIDQPRAATTVTATATAVAELRPPLYAKVGIRVRAVLIDYFVLLIGYVLVSVLGARLHDIAIAGPLLMGSWILVMLLYEPLMVSRTGGTIGHHVKNIRVVSDATGGHPGLFAALARSLTKAMFGWLSFLFILGSERQQALHDTIARVTVRIKDERLARRRDYVRGRTSA